MKETITVIPSEDQTKRFRYAARRTWDIIGEDIFAACEEQGESTTLPRADVVELVLDADHIETNGSLSKEDIALWRSLTSKQQNEIVLSAFPHALYGR